MRSRMSPSIERQKMEKTMHEFSEKKLHSGSKHGPLVRNRKQAIAIGISEGKKARRGGYRRKGAK